MWAESSTHCRQCSSVHYRGHIGSCRRGFGHMSHMHSGLHRAPNEHAICLLGCVKNQIFNKCFSPLIWNQLDTIVLLYQHGSAESYLLQLAVCKELWEIKIWNKRRWEREVKLVGWPFLHQMLLHLRKKKIQPLSWGERVAELWCLCSCGVSALETFAGLSHLLQS